MKTITWDKGRGRATNPGHGRTQSPDTDCVSLDALPKLGFLRECKSAFVPKRQPYWGAHLIFALHYYSFESIVSGLLVRIAPMASPLIPIGIGYVYLYFALRRIHGQKYPITFVKTVGLYLAVVGGEVVIVGATVLGVAKLWP